MREAELRGIGKKFGNFTALADIHLAFRSGEIHTILGENGAGKSTLVHILSGLYTSDSGSIVIDGKETAFSDPSAALDAGIAMVHQRPLLSDGTSAFENIIAGARGCLLHRKKRHTEILRIAREWDIDIKLSTLAGILKPADRLRTALLAALYRKPSFLILDEPTAVLAPEERELFMTRLRAAAQNGLGIILITHKLAEAVRWSDRITILRHGKIVFSDSLSREEGPAVTEESLAHFLDPLESGGVSLHSENLHSISCPIQNAPTQSREPLVFLAEGLSASPVDSDPIFDVSFTASPGTITGIFGLPGSGIETLEDVLTGMLRADSGSVTITPRDLWCAGASLPENCIPARKLDPTSLRQRSVALVPSNRTYRGSHPELSIEEALSPRFTATVLFSRKQARGFAQRVIETERIHAESERLVSTLSGGQLQRLILARELAGTITGEPGIIILSEPEWGLDIRSIGLLRKKLLAAASRGTTVIILTDTPDTMHGRDFYTATWLLKEGRLS